MKKILVLGVLLMVLSSVSHAFLYEINILDDTQIRQLTDKALAEVYQEAKIEEKASAEFHYGAGFSSAKEYQKRKDLLRFIISLRREMARRLLETEPIDEWLK